MKASRKPSRSWKLFWIYFRRFRIGLWFVILGLLSSLLYLNQIGLPGFIKNRLLETLRARGVELQFTRLRLRFPYGIVADNVRFGSTADSASPTFTFKEIQVRLDYYQTLVKRQVQIDSLRLWQGQLFWPIAGSNPPVRVLKVQEIQTELRFLTGDVWQMDNLQAQFAGANIQVEGTLTNATAIRDWKLFQSQTVGGQGPTPGEGLRKQLRQVLDTLDQIHFLQAPGLKLELSGDAHDLTSFGAHLTLKAVRAATPWGRFEHVDFDARLQPSQARESAGITIHLQTASARTPWGNAQDLEATLHGLTGAGADYDANLKLSAATVQGAWGRGQQAQLTAQCRLSSTNAMPLSGQGRLQLALAETRWGSGRELKLSAAVAPALRGAELTHADLGGWKYFTPYAISWEARLADLAAPQGVLTNLVCAGEWQPPDLQIKTLSADLYDGSLQAQGRLAVVERALTFQVVSDAQWQQIPALLTPVMRSRLDPISWGKPLQIQVAGSLQLPPWTNALVPSSVLWSPSAQLSGWMSLTNVSFRGLPFSAVASHFSCTNQDWRFPDLRMLRPEGGLESVLEYDQRRQDFALRLHSTLDLNVARQFLSPDQQKRFELAKLTMPPDISAQMRGNLLHPDQWEVHGQVAVTNFSFRGQTASVLISGVDYTNRILTLREPQLQRGASEHLAAASVVVDIGRRKVFINQGVGTANPLAVARAIGPLTGQWFEPYRFLKVPTSRVNGTVGFDIEDGVDLHFEMEGGPFEWWRFKVQHIAGQVNWVNDSLTLKGVHAEFYQGQAAGEAAFHFPKEPGTDLRFALTVTNADLHLLLMDLSPGSNRLAGLLTGFWNLTNGNTLDMATWQGYGHLSLTNGLIMAIPVFGVLSPVVDGLVPGLGANRLNGGTANFVMANGTIHSDDLDIRGSGMRLLYRGDLDLAGRVKARATAELLRDTRILGPLISVTLWPVSKFFEFKISGQLGDPKMEPANYISRLILFPLHPIETMKDLLPKTPEAVTTNLPPAGVR